MNISMNYIKSTSNVKRTCESNIQLNVKYGPFTFIIHYNKPNETNLSCNVTFIRSTLNELALFRCRKLLPHHGVIQYYKRHCKIAHYEFTSALENYRHNKSYSFKYCTFISNYSYSALTSISIL